MSISLDFIRNSNMQASDDDVDEIFFNTRYDDEYENTYYTR